MSAPLNLLQAAKAEAANKIRKARGDRELDPTEQAIEDAQILEGAIINLLYASRNIRTGILAGLWECYRDQRFLLMGEYNSFSEWISERFASWDQDMYIHQLALIVTRIFQKVHQRHVQGDPFLTQDGEVITVDLLLERPGLIYKLKALSKTFEDQADEGDTQEAILDTILNGTRQDVETLRDRVNGGGITVRIPYVTKHLTDGTVFTTKPLNDDQVSLFLSLLGDAGEALVG